MESRKFEIIQQLMEELQEEMQPGEEDFSSRLGRKKPGMEILKVEGEMSPKSEGEIDMDMEGREEFCEPMDGEEMEESPDERFKNRLMKLRG